MAMINDLTSGEELEQYLHEGKLLIIDFWAPWCASCKAMLPSLERLAKDNPKIVRLVKINVDQFEPLAQRFNVRGLPCIVVYYEQKEVLRMNELLSSKQLTDVFSPWLNTDYLALLNQAQCTQDHNAALTLLKQASVIAPQQSEVHLAYIQRLLAAAENDGWQHALTYLEGLSHESLREPEISRVHSYLNLISKVSQHSNELQPIFRYLLAENYVNAIEDLSLLIQRDAQPEIKQLIIQILNIMPDRKLAQSQRLKVFRLIQ